jgi:hypothetical protein
MRSKSIIAGAALALGIAILTVVSPLLLPVLGRLPLDWAELANVGQAYGLASALLGGIALVGVSASLFIQTRQHYSGAMFALRQQHMDLVKICLDRPSLAGCWGDETASQAGLPIEQSLYINLILTHWEMCWDMGLLTDEQVRLYLSSFFTGQAARLFWGQQRGARLVTGEQRRIRQWLILLDREYERSAKLNDGPIETQAH